MLKWRIIGLMLLAVGCGCRSTPRVDRTLNDGWRFNRSDVAGAAAETFDDATWSAVTLPHTWNAKDGQDGGDDYYRGACWYRRELHVDASDAGKRFFLRFEAASIVAEVFVNGRSVGSHRGAFGAFCFDVTPMVHAGANTVAVRVDNSKFDDIAPLSGDFTMFGGLYRPVHLLVLDPLAVSPMDDGSSGVYLAPRERVDGGFDIEATIQVQNLSGAAKGANVVCEIADAARKVVARAETDASVSSNSVADVHLSMLVEHPRRWNGREDPYLYQAIVTVRDGTKVTDVVRQPVGFRSFRIEDERGLILNGKPYPLHGVNRHQDRFDKGWAISQADTEEDFRLITEMGCTGVRLAHFQQSDDAYALCDKLGLVCWAEAGLVNDITHTPAFAENAKQQLRELIKQNYNHPSIFFWSLYNELAMKTPEFADEQKLVKELDELAHLLDTTRLTTAATHKQKVDHPVNWIPDVTGFNRYFGWYEGKPGDWAAGLDGLRKAMPGKRIGISEYGAGASIAQHEASPTKPRTGGAWHPEEWQSIVHEEAWAAMKDRPWVWGTFVWVMFDFAADARSEGDWHGRNDKGLVTADRKTRKDAFYFYQANWTHTPVLHITSGRFNPRPSGKIEVKVYSNCDAVELFLNGVSQGVRPGESGVFLWGEVELREGNNRVIARGVRDGKMFEDELTWQASRTAATRLSAEPAR